jgi:two-component system, OmpR family, alkaline phosphatase synthesis response regulator PhoP
LFRLPLVREVEAGTQAYREKNSMSQRVLLCDDEIHIIRAAEFKFRRAGFEVECASDGQFGWEAIERQMPDLVITDCQMPRLSGLGLIERMREHEATKTLPVMMLTAKGFELSQAEMAAKWGVLAIIAKPFSPRDLVRMAEEALAGKVPVAAAAEAVTT